MEEYYVKAPETENEDGPFTLDQLKELVESGLLTPASLVRASTEAEFLTLSENPALWDAIKPVPKPALKLRSRSTSSDGNPDSSPANAAENATSEKTQQKSTPAAKAPAKKQTSPPSPYEESKDITRMLSAAEGKTEQTRHIQRLKKSRARAVGLLLPSLVFTLLMSVAIIVQPSWQAIFEMFKSGNYSLEILTGNWLLLFAIADLFLAIGIGLGQTGLFSLMRLRCGIGIGFFLFLFYSRQEWAAAGAITAMQLGLIGATLCIRLSTTLFFSLLALGGGATMIWLVWFKGIVL